MQKLIFPALLSLLAATILQPAPASAAETGKQAFESECSACHLAYDPGFLPQRSWRAILGDLPNHFGEDASLDEATLKQIESYVLANAADANGRNPYWLRRIPADKVPLRITELPWFWNEHGNRLRAWARSKKAVGSISNCEACHRGAGRGRFEDD